MKKFGIFLSLVMVVISFLFIVSCGNNEGKGSDSSTVNSESSSNSEVVNLPEIEFED